MTLGRNEKPQPERDPAGAKFVMSTQHPATGCADIGAECSSAVNRLQRMSALRNKSPSRVGSLAGAKSELSLIHPDGDRDAPIFRPNALRLSTLHQERLANSKQSHSVLIAAFLEIGVNAA
jgi:hypothetical protein